MQTSQEGDPRPMIFATPPPFHGNVIQIGPVLHSTEDVEQGKGGPIIEEQRVHRTYAIRICEGPAACLKAWRDGKLVYDVTGTGDIDAESAEAASKLTFYIGDETQLPDPVLEALPVANGGGAGEVNAYRGTAYMVVDRDNLTGTGGRIPTWTFLMTSRWTITAGNSGLPWFANDTEDELAVSDGGLDWSDANTTLPRGGEMLYGEGRLVISDNVETWFSDDHGQSWTQCLVTEARALSNIHGAYIGSKFWFLSSSGEDDIASSPDGENWSTQTVSTTGGLDAIGGHPGLIVVGDNTGQVRCSRDGGGTWEPAIAVFGAIEYVTAVGTDGSKVVIGGRFGSFAHTTDGEIWTTVSDPFGTATPVSAIAYGGGVWVALNTGGGIARSLDGEFWTRISGMDSFVGWDVAYGSGLFVAGGGNGLIYTSPDGETWTSRANNFSESDVVRDIEVAPCGGVEMPDSPGYYVQDDGTICGPVRDSITPLPVYLSDVELAIARRCGIPVGCWTNPAGEQ